MALVLKDRVQETTTTTGTGTLTLGGAVTGYQSFSAIGNANTTYYAIYANGGSEWEVGIGTYTASGTTLSRDTVLASSNSGSLVNFSAGTKNVWCDYPAGKAAFQDASGVVTAPTFTASTSVITPIVQATNSAGLALKNSGGTTQMSMGAGGGDNLAINVSTNLNGTNAQIDISPTGTGHVHIKPTGTNSVEIAPTSVGTINNMTIGATTAVAGSFTDLSVTGTTSFDGSQGTAGQVLTSAGTGATPTWTTPTTGTVTSVTGTSPVVSSGGTTPAISMPAATTSVNGYLTSTDWNTFNNKGSGTVTSVSGTAPVVSSGGATPAISMAAATTSVNGYLTSTDWTTFNGKQAALVSGTNIKTVSGTSLLGSGDLGLIGATYGGTGVNNGSNTITVAGNLTHAGAFTQSFTASANTAVTLPAGATAASNNLLSSATAVGIVTGTPSSSNYLRGDGTWSTVTATAATNLSGGATGSLPYQSGASTTAFLTGNTTTTPQFLTSTGSAGAATAPTLTGSTGSGNVVLATSPTLVTPALGTPSAINLTNATSLPYVALPAGSVLQIIQSSNTSAVSTTSISFVTTGFSATITPKFSTSKILALVSCGNVYQSLSGAAGNLNLYRGSTALAAGIFGFSLIYNSVGVSEIGQSFNYLDSPATTSATTYTIYYSTSVGGTFYINTNNGVANIILMEIAA